MTYGTITGFNEYHTARGRDVDAFGDAAISAALLVASEWIDARYHASFSGLKVGMRAQVREWPRTGAVDRYGYAIDPVGVPVEVTNATYEAALRDLNTPGSLSVDWTPNAYKSASVDGAVSVQYAMYNGANEIQTVFQIINEIIAPVLTGYGANVSVLSAPGIRA